MKASGSFFVLILSFILIFNINFSNGAQMSDDIKLKFIQNVKENLMKTFESQKDYDRLQRELLKSRNQQCYENLNQLMNAKNKDKYFELESLLFPTNPQSNHGRELVDLFNDTVNTFFDPNLLKLIVRFLFFSA
jgi:hypothetical protein